MRALVASGMALVAVTYGMARFGYGLFLPQFTEAFAMTSAVAGAVQAGSFLSYCVAALIALRLSARPRAVVLLAGGSAGLGSLGVALAPDAVVFAVAVVVAGAGAGFVSPGLVTLIGRNLAPPRQESAQTVVNSGSGVGIVAAGLLLILTLGQWRAGWVVIAAAAVLATVATLRADRVGDQDRDVAPRPPMRPGDLAPLLRPVVAAVLAGASSAGIWTFGRSILAASRPEAETYSIVAWMLLGAFGVVGGVAGRAVQVWGLRSAWTVFAATMAVGTAVLGLAPGALPVAYPAMALFGVGYTALTGVLIVWAVRLVPDRASEGTVVLYVALAVGQAVGAMGLGVLHGAAAPPVTLAVAGLLGLLSVLPAQRGVLSMRRSRPRPAYAPRPR